MKKYALEYREGDFDYFFNLGDELQTIAAVELLGSVDGYLPRDTLHTADQDGLLSMNGFFMGSENWPPHESLKPVFYSFHLDKRYEKTICSKEGIDYLKKHEPIGCRDEGTVNILRKYGVDAFYSGCLTLTLPKRSQNEEVNAQEIFIVGVDRVVSRCIPKEIRKKAIKINQHGVRLPKISCDLKREMGRQLLKGYACNAKLVITSKIHCAMPCLAMGIPVVFLYPKDKKDDYRVHLISNLIPINYISTSSVVSSLGLHKIFSDKVNWNPSPIDFEELKAEIINGFYKAVDRAGKKVVAEASESSKETEATSSTAGR